MRRSWSRRRTQWMCRRNSPPSAVGAFRWSATRRRASPRILATAGGARARTPTAVGGRVFRCSRRQGDKIVRVADTEVGPDGWLLPRLPSVRTRPRQRPGLGAGVPSCCLTRRRGLPARSLSKVALRMRPGPPRPRRAWPRWLRGRSRLRRGLGGVCSCRGGGGTGGGGVVGAEAKGRGGGREGAAVAVREVSLTHPAAVWAQGIVHHLVRGHQRRPGRRPRG